MMKFYRIVILLFVAACSVCSCDRMRLKHNLERFSGSEIVFPPGLQMLLGGRDTVIDGFADARTRMVVYFDSLGCSSCRVTHMPEWNEVVDYARQSEGRFGVLFVFSPKQGRRFRHEVRTSLRSSHFDYPVFLDTAGAFPRSNPSIPSDKRFHTFLLDGENRVVMAGSPENNERLWQLYKEEIEKITAQ